MKVALPRDHVEALTDRAHHGDDGPGNVDGIIRHALRSFFADPAHHHLPAEHITTPDDAVMRPVALGAHLERDVRRCAARTTNVTPAAVIRAAAAHHLHHTPTP